MRVWRILCVLCFGVALATLAGAQCSTGVGGDLTLGPGNHTINTDSGMVDGVVSPGWDGTAFQMANIDIAGNVTVSGSQALILLGTGTVNISGTIDASGGNGGNGNSGCNAGSGTNLYGGAGGPGGFDGGAGGGFASNGGSGIPSGADGGGPGGGQGGIVTGTNGSAGGGGGGHRNAGQNGSPGLSPGIGGSGGASYASLPPLIGGSGGGGGSVEKDGGTAGVVITGDDDGAGGGGGGGAVQILTDGAMTVSGTIDVSGGNGGNGDCSGGDGGGGAGGAVELGAAATPTVTGTLNVSGGSGGATWGGDGSDGRTLVGIANCGAAPGPCNLAPIEAKLDDETRFTSDSEFDAAVLLLGNELGNINAGLGVINTNTASLEGKIDDETRFTDDQEFAALEAAITSSLNNINNAVEALEATMAEMFCDIEHQLLTPQGRRCTETSLCGYGMWNIGLESHVPPVRCGGEVQLGTSSPHDGPPVGSYAAGALRSGEVDPLLVIPSEQGGMLDEVAGVVREALAQYRNSSVEVPDLWKVEEVFAEAERLQAEGDLPAAYLNYRKAYQSLSGLSPTLE